jgi:hypothetical protein
MTTRTQSAIGKKRIAVKLCAEAFNTVESKAEEIVLALFESTMKGHPMSAKLLVELAEGSVDLEGILNKDPFRSLALRLGAEPQVVNATMHKVPETDTYSTELLQG